MCDLAAAHDSYLESQCQAERDHFTEGAHWDTLPGGIIRRDLTPKPAYDRLVSLIHGRWWTDEAAVTDCDGQATVRAFHGEYEITVRAGGSPVTRAITVHSGRTSVVTLRL